MQEAEQVYCHSFVSSIPLTIKQCASTLRFINHICSMFQRLQRKWKVSGVQFWMIFSTFAVTGTVTAWLSRSITLWLQIDKFTAQWWLLKILVLFFGYQIFLLCFGFCFGQFSFFWKYERKLLEKIKILKKGPAKLVIFASGSGSNAEKLIAHFHAESYNGPRAKVMLMVCNNPAAGVMKIAKERNIPTLLIDKNRFYNGDSYLPAFRDADLLILAGFLWKVPDSLVSIFKNKIVNIHPALLPKYGGKGKYGIHVHEAVIAADEKESGITIHLVDEQYDHGTILFQTKCSVDVNDTPLTLQKKILQLEHLHYPLVIENMIAKSTLNKNH